MATKIYDSITRLNLKYRGDQVNLSQPNRKGDNYMIIDNKSSIMLSAPHAVKQFRETIQKADHLKGADVYTGGIAEYLCQTTGANGIIRTFNKKDDPNFYADGPSGAYKEALKKVLVKNKCTLLIDFHGCAEDSSHDVYLGVNGGKNLCGNTKLLDDLVKAMKKAKIDVVVDQDDLCASYKYNLSRQISEDTGIPCIQMELRKPWRVTEEKLNILIPVLEKFIKAHK